LASKIVGKEEEIKDYILYIKNDGTLFERAISSQALKKA